MQIFPAENQAESRRGREHRSCPEQQLADEWTNDDGQQTHPSSRAKFSFTELVKSWLPLLHLLYTASALYLPLYFILTTVVSSSSSEV